MLEYYVKSLFNLAKIECHRSVKCLFYKVMHMRSPTRQIYCNSITSKVSARTYTPTAMALALITAQSTCCRLG